MMKSPTSRQRAMKKEMIKNFFSKENVEKRKKEKIEKLQSEGAEFMSEAKVREVLKSNKVNGYKKMKTANKHINHLVKIFENRK